MADCVRYLLDEEGNRIKKDGKEVESNLYNDLMDYADGDDMQADAMYEALHSGDFTEEFGDWLGGFYGRDLDENGEPVLNEEIRSYLDREFSDNVVEQRDTDDGADRLNPDQLDKIIDKYSPAFEPYGVRIKFNSEMEPRARLTYQDGRPVVEFNQDKVTLDTPLHEFASLYLDLLGGMDNFQVSAARDQLKGSQIEKDVLEAYPDLTGTQLDLEIVATAIGKQEYKRDTLLGRILRKVMDLIKRTFGIPPDHVAQLARDVSTGRLSPDVKTAEFGVKYYSSPRTVQQAADDIRDRIQRKVKIYENSQDTQEKQNAVNSLKALLNRMATLNAEESINAFLENSSRQIDGLNEALDDPDISMDRLHQAATYLKSFDIVHRVGDLIREQYSETMTKEKLREKLDKINNVKNKYDEVLGKYHTRARKKLAKRLSDASGRLPAIRAEEYEKEYKRNNPREPGQKRKDWDKKAQEYARRKIADNHDDIRAEQTRTFEDWLLTAPRDLGAVESWLVDPRNLSDPLIQAFVSQIDNVDFNIKRLFNNRVKDIQDAVKPYLDKTSGGKQEKLWEPFLEKIDGKITGNLVGKYLSTYLNDRKTYEKQKTKELGSKGADNKQAWEEAMRHWYENIKPTYINPQWTNMSQENRDLLATFHKSLTDNDSLVEPKQQLVRTYESKLDDPVTVYGLPVVAKTSMERLRDNGTIEAFGRGFKDLVQRDQSPDDVVFGNANNHAETGIEQVLANEADQEHRTVPVFYRGDRPIKDRSFDIPTILSLNTYTSVNYNEKMKQMATAEIFKDIMYNRKVTQTSGVMDTLRVPHNSRKRLEKAIGDSNSYKALKSIVDHRIYGIGMIDPGKWGNASLGKISQRVAQWTGDTMLAFNYYAMFGNIAQGKASNFIESRARRYVKSKHGLAEAERIYWANFPQWAQDIGADRYQSKVNLMRERVDSMYDAGRLKSQIGETSRATRLANRGVLHVFTNSMEHYIHNTMMIAILNDLKAIDENGSVIKKEDGSDMTMWDAYRVENKRTVLDERVKGTDRFGVGDAEFQASRLVKKVNSDLHGNYDSENLAYAQRTVIGSMAFMLRKWLIRGVQRRFRGWSEVLGNRQQDPYYRQFVSEDLQESQEGLYISGVKLLRNIFTARENSLLQSISTNWDSLSFNERANIRALVTEFALMGLSIGAYHFLRQLADGVDEDDEDKVLFGAYVFRRTVSEFAFYFNPMEFSRIMANPAASVSMIKRAGRLIGRTATMSNWEEYETGPYAGEYKLKRDVADVVPVWNVLERDVAMALSYVESFGL